MDIKAINYTSNGILICIEGRCLNLSKITYFIIEPSGINNGFMISINGKSAIFTTKRKTKQLLDVLNDRISLFYKKVYNTYFNVENIYEISIPKKSIAEEDSYRYTVNGETFSFKDKKCIKEVKELIKEL